MNRILVTGAKGQIGSDLVTDLRSRYGSDRIIESDILAAPATNGSTPLIYERLDVRDRKRLEQIVDTYEVETIFHLASLLSASGEHSPDAAWEVNVGGLKNVLDVARKRGTRVFWPSSMAVFGPSTPRHATPQSTILEPTTIYGVTKVTGELLCRYYADRFDVDVRSVRYPGIISFTAPPGGGTTDYAVEIFYAALQQGSFTCFVRADTRLPMMYMPDAVRAAIELMDADPGRISVRTSYNLAAMSFSAEELAGEIQRYLPDFACRYEPDYHQDIADSWPEEIDDAAARADWGWAHRWALAPMVEDMLKNLSRRLHSREGAGDGSPGSVPAQSNR